MHERRAFPAEFRLEGDGTPKIVGHAAVFNSFSEDLGGFREIIRPGAFTRTLANNADVRLLINHEGLPLARTVSGTLQLREDERGLHITAELDPEDPDVKRVLPKMRRKDLSNMSFAFQTVRDAWRTENASDVRELHDVDLFDVSLVTYPAYPAAAAALRSHQTYQAERQRAAGVPNQLNNCRLRMAELE